MEDKKTVAMKQHWLSPKMVIYGTVEEITMEIPIKSFGPGDGAVWQGNPVHWDYS